MSFSNSISTYRNATIERPITTGCSYCGACVITMSACRRSQNEVHNRKHFISLCNTRKVSKFSFAYYLQSGRLFNYRTQIERAFKIVSFFSETVCDPTERLCSWLVDIVWTATGTAVPVFEHTPWRSTRKWHSLTVQEIHRDQWSVILYSDRFIPGERIPKRRVRTCRRRKNSYICQECWGLG